MGALIEDSRTRPALPRRVFIGADIGQANDYTALTVVDRQDSPPLGTVHGDLPTYKYTLRFIERIRHIPYPDIIKRIISVTNSEKLPRDPVPVLVIDATGVGKPILDLIRRSTRGAKLKVIGVVITGGTQARCTRGVWNVPKRNLAFTVVEAYQTRRLIVPEGLSLRDALTNELRNFKVKINSRTGHDTYAADWRDGDHDDIILSLAVALWWAEKDSHRSKVRVRF